MSAFELSEHPVACSQTAASRSIYSSLTRLTTRYTILKIKPRAIHLYPEQLNALRHSLKRSGFDLERQPLIFKGYPLQETAR